MVNYSRFWFLSIISVAVFNNFSAFGQIGFSGIYTRLSAPNWETAIEQKTAEEIQSWPGQSFSVNTAIRWNKKRLEFEPELSFGRGQAEISNSSAQLQSASLGLNVMVYPFDFHNNCNCPVWLKSGGAFKKGFFLLLYAGGTRFTQELILPGSGISGQSFAGFYGAGAGIDLGLSKIITLTPLIRRIYYPSVHWENLSGQGSLESDLKFWQFGLKLGFRFDA